MNNRVVLEMILENGSFTGIVESRIKNRDQICYKIPRARISDAQNLDFITNTGVYVLIGKPDAVNEGTEGHAYIGEAENIIERIKQHIKNKDFWNECVVYMSTSNSINKAHVKYIENKLWHEAKENGRYFVENETEPTKSSLSNSDQIVAEDCIESIKVFVSTMGYRIFDKILQENTSNNNLILSLKHNKEIIARAMMVDEGFVVLKGSRMRTEIQPSYGDSMKRSREQTLKSGDVKDFEFINDHLFSTPSTAASVILGRNSNGYDEWKNAEGKSLNDILERE